MRATLSRPARARGLKPLISVFAKPNSFVAPRAGAWIETPPLGLLLERRLVAPRAGAWIETVFALCCGCRTPSRPARARGLKLKYLLTF